MVARPFSSSRRRNHKHWEICVPASLIESDRISKLNFKRRRACIHSKATKNTSRMPPGSRLRIQFEIIQEFLYSCGQPSKWSPNSMAQECTLNVRSCHNRGWEVEEILSQQTSSHIEPSGRQKEKGRLSFLLQYCHSHTLSSLISHQRVAW